MSDDNRMARQALETRIDAALFGRRYWAPPREIGKLRNVLSYSEQAVPIGHIEITPAEAATYSWIFHHRAYCSDWSLVPELLDGCVQRDWGIQLEYTRHASESWFVVLVFDDGGDEYNDREAYADSLPLALCRAIVDVLDATEGTEKS